MQKIQNDYKDKNVAVLMLNVDQEQYRVPLFLKKNPASAVVLLSTEKVKQDYNERGIPLTVIVDRNGKVRYRKDGFDSGDEKKLREMVESLLKDGDK